MTTSSAPAPALVPGIFDTEPVWLDQVQASAYLRTLGVILAPKTLQTRRVIGGGPPFRRIVGRVVYERDPLRAWAVAQRSPLFASTSEAASKSS